MIKVIILNYEINQDNIYEIIIQNILVFLMDLYNAYFYNKTRSYIKIKKYGYESMYNIFKIFVKDYERIKTILNL